MLLFFYAISLPFYGVIAEIGLQVTPILVVGIGMLFYLILKSPFMRLPIVLVPYFIYILTICIVLSFFLPDSVYRYPPLRGTYRWVSQIVYFILLYTPIIFIYNIKPRINEIANMVYVFIGTTILLCITGLIQLYIYKISGKDIFPINLFSPGEKEEFVRSALSRLGGDIRVLRMSALGGGEPKHFGYTCVMAFNLLVLQWVFVKSFGIKKLLLNLFMACVLILCVFLTLSTQSYILLGLDVVLLLVVMMFTVGMKKLRVLSLILLMGLGSFVIYKSSYTRTLIEARIYNRLEETGAIEDFNLTILDFLKDNPRFLPFGTGLGNVHLFAFPYIPNEFKYYMKDSVFVAKAGLLRIISEQGFVGLFLFLMILTYLGIKFRDPNVMIPREWKYLVLSFLIITITNYMISSDSSPYYVFSIALCFALITTRQREIA